MSTTAAVRIDGLTPQDMAKSYINQFHYTGSGVEVLRHAVLMLGDAAHLVVGDATSLRHLATTAGWLADQFDALPASGEATVRYSDHQPALADPEQVAPADVEQVPA